MLLVDRAALWFPSLGSPILIEEHATAHTSRIPCQELAVPYLAPGCKFLEPQGVPNRRIMSSCAIWPILASNSSTRGWLHDRRSVTRQHETKEYHFRPLVIWTDRQFKLLYRDLIR